MIAVDTNILVYAHRSDSPFFAAASACLRDLSMGAAPWAIAWPCLYEFYSVVTHPKIYVPPTPLARVLDQIEAWLESPKVVLLSETSMHWSVLRDMLRDAKIDGPRVHDARIAALCLQNGVSELWTADRDFGRFPQIRVRNPLVRLSR